MALEDMNGRRRQPEQSTVQDALDSIHRFSGGNQRLKVLMEDYIFLSRTVYVLPQRQTHFDDSTRFPIQDDLEKIASERISSLTNEILNTLITDDKNAYIEGRTRYAEKDRFRNYVLLGNSVGNREVDGLLGDVQLFAFFSADSVTDRKMAELEGVWEYYHPGKTFMPAHGDEEM